MVRANPIILLARSFGPTPPHNEAIQSVSPVLKWKADRDPDWENVTFDVYLQKDTSSPSERVAQNLSAKDLRIHDLEPQSQYSWKVVARDERDLTTESDVWTFFTGDRENRAPDVPASPTPDMGAVDVPVDTVLSWSGSDPDGDDISYDVYLDSANNPPTALIASSLQENSVAVSKLEPNTTYFWRVAVADEWGVRTDGAVWQFTTGDAANSPPYQPSEPTPADQSTNVAMESLLAWMGGDPDGDAVRYDIYFEANDNSPDQLIAENYDGTSLSPPALAYLTQYYWQVVARDTHGSEMAGPVWGFTSTRGFEYGDITRVSIASDGSEGDRASETPSLSADGRFVAFTSFSTNLVATDANGTADIYLHDRDTSVTAQVSVSSDGRSGNAFSYFPAVSSDGRIVAFHSWATNLVSGDTNQASDIFVHDRELGTTTRVSIASNGTPGNGSSEYASISADGRFVAFLSEASNLVPNDFNGVSDVFVHDRDTGETTMVSVASDGSQGNDGPLRVPPVISDDGRFVAYTSSATNLVADDNNNKNDVFIHDRQTGETARVSVADDGSEGNGDSWSPSISMLWR